MSYSKFPIIVYEDLTKIQDEEQMNSTITQYENLLDREDIEYPYASYFLSKEEVMQKIIDAPKTHRAILKKKGEYLDRLPNFLNHMRFVPSKEQSWVIEYDEEDYERIDIITNHFSEYIRVRARHKKYHPPIIAYISLRKKIINNAITYALENKMDLSAKSMSEGIFLSSVKICTTFKISVGMSVFDDLFRCKRVFDPFAGWGDRGLSAICSKGVHYYKGIDVNSSLAKSYNEIKKINPHPHKFIDFEINDISDVNLQKEITEMDIDLVFSSPPFFDYEFYSSDSGQSTNKYPKYKDWLYKWLIPITRSMALCLKSGGRLCYYMGGHDKFMIETLIRHMTYEGGNEHLIFRGQIGVLSANDPCKRPMFLLIWQKK